MHKITLEWQEDNQNVSRTISSEYQTKTPRVIRIGRDPSQCDVIIQDSTNRVSRLHAEIFFNLDENSFYIRNVTLNQGQPNVILINNQPVVEDEILAINNEIKLRDFPIKIVNIEVEQSTNLFINNSNNLLNQPNNQTNNLINNSNSTYLAQNHQANHPVQNNQYQQYIPSNENQNINQNINENNPNENNPNETDIKNPTLNLFNQAANQNQQQNQNSNYQLPNQQPSNTVSGDIQLNQSLLQAASQDNFDAISTMFRQFIPDDEKIHFARYLGIQGIWGFGTRQFACVSDRRVADITVGRFGTVTYQDGYLEHIHSGVVYQPSKFWLYFLIGIYLIFALSYILPIMTLVLSSLIGLGGFNIVALFATLILLIFSLGLTFLALITMVRWYYRFVKCGLVLAVTEGEPLVTAMGTYAFTQRLVYIFTNRKFITRANALYRCFIIQREARLDIVKKYPVTN
ncbi:MAG: FHA domain-containing protein [Calothrix sp. CSU_2_0]|nr:FHA domain-containing protein [Calothrix sp. CSU_2_0]